MSEIIDIHSREELTKFLRSIIDDDSRISNLADEILSQPSGELISFVCRQADDLPPQDLRHKQQVIRIFHN